MNKRIRTTILAACMMLLCLAIPAALAATASVTISTDQIGTVKSSKKALSSTAISGSVSSKTGMIYTHGSVFEVKRDSESVWAGGYANLYWSNPNSETGQFDVRISSPGGHKGSCSASN
jgi:hypothetical protein